MESRAVDATPGLGDLLTSDDLFHRTGGIASWTESATYIVQPACPRVAEANQARLIALPEGVTRECFFKELTDLFADHGVKSYQIHLDARTQPPDLGPFLVEKGLLEERDTLFLSDSPPPLPSLPVHVLETTEEAVHRDFEEIMDQRSTESLDGEVCLQLADLRTFRREAGLLKHFVGYYEGHPAGVITLLQAGSLVRVKDLLVSPSFAFSRVDQAILAMVLGARFAQGATQAGLFGRDADSNRIFLDTMGFRMVGEAWIYSRIG